MAAEDVVFSAVVVFVLAIAFFAGHFIINEVYNDAKVNPQINSSSGAVAAMENAQNLTARFDYVILAVFIGLCLGMIITGWFIGGNPIFMFIYFLIVLISVIISAVLSNIWYDVSNTSTLVATLSSFPITNHIVLALPLYIGIVGFIGIVVMFGKSLAGGGE